MAWNPHITVAAVVERDSKFLFVEELVNGAKVINQPAGHLEDGESFAEAVIREAYEETAWTIEPTHVIAVHRWLHQLSKETFIRVSFAATAIKHNPDQTLDVGIIRPIWLDRNELMSFSDSLRSPMVLDGVNRYLQGSRYPLDLFVNL